MKKRRKNKKSSPQKLSFRTPKTIKKSVQVLTRWVIGLALLPLLWAILKITGFIFPVLAKEGYSSWWIYVSGLAGYLIFERLIHKPMWLYVVGHELTHAFSGVLSGAKIHSLKAHSSGGEVRLSKSNAFIAISPYIFPFYTVLVLISYALISHWWKHSYLTMGFQLFIGLSLGFHWSLTWEAMHKGQSDLKVLGFFLSGVLILIGNVLIVGFLTVGLFRSTPTLKAYGKSITAETKIVWKTGYTMAKERWTWLP